MHKTIFSKFFRGAGKGLLAAMALALITALPVSQAAAATLNINLDGKLTGADGVIVDGQSYNVSFTASQSCAALFSGCDDLGDFIFNSAASATMAMAALRDQVFLDGPDGNFDSDPLATLGCDALVLEGCGIWMPYNFAGSYVEVGVFLNKSGGLADSLTGGFVSMPNGLLPGHLTFAKFTAVAPVPLPAGFVLLLGGLGALMGLRRRRTAVA